MDVHKGNQEEMTAVALSYHRRFISVVKSFKYAYDTLMIRLWYAYDTLMIRFKFTLPDRDIKYWRGKM